MDSDKRSKIEVLLRILLTAQKEVHMILASENSFLKRDRSRPRPVREDAPLVLPLRGWRRLTSDFRKLWTIWRPQPASTGLPKRGECGDSCGTRRAHRWEGPRDSQRVVCVRASVVPADP